VAALARESFLVREKGSGTRAAMEQFFAQQRLRPVSTTEISSNETIKQAVMAGLGLAFLSHHTIGLELKTRQLALIHLTGLPVLRHWNVVHLLKKRLSPAALAFQSFVLHEGAQFLKHWPQG
jgi:DNA-binding transcriptional LysR family regulator